MKFQLLFTNILMSMTSYSLLQWHLVNSHSNKSNSGCWNINELQWIQVAISWTYTAYYKCIYKILQSTLQLKT